MAGPQRLSIARHRRCLPVGHLNLNDREAILCSHDVDPQTLDPINKNPLQANFVRLLGLVGTTMEPGAAGRYTALLNSLADDHTYNGVTYLGLIRTPAARTFHHAFEGGLVVHYLEMWTFWEALKAGKPELVDPPYITDRRVLQAVLNHDLHKSFAHYVHVSTDDGSWRVIYGKHETDLFLNNTLKSLWLLTRHGIELDPEQLHALAWAEGGYSDQKEIRTTSALAKLCYTLDELSGNVLSALQTSTQLGHHGAANATYLNKQERHAHS